MAKTVKYIVYKKHLAVEDPQFGGDQWRPVTPPLTKEQADQYIELFSKKEELVSFKMEKAK